MANKAREAACAGPRCQRSSPRQPSPSDAMPTAHLLADDPSSSTRTAMSLRLPQADSLAAFGLRVSRQFAQCRRDGAPLALLWLEVDTPLPLDEAARDALLRAIGLRLRNRLRGADEVVHMGDASFALLLHAAGAPEAGLVEHRLRAALRGNYDVEGRLLQVGVRMGRALHPEAGRNGAELAQAARDSLSLQAQSGA